MKKVLRELIILLLLILVMGALIHGSEFPERFSIALSEPSTFQHSIFYSLIIYIILWIPRLALKFMRNGKKKESSEQSE